MRAGLYARVSTDAQAEQGYSLDTQLEACRGKAAEIGASAVRQYVDDGYSAADMDRPQLQQLRDDLRDGLIAAVICFDPDRLARNLSHQLIISEEIDKAGAVLHFVSADFARTPEGKLFYSIRGAIAEFEKEKIRERSVRGKRGKAQRGKIVHNARPFGFDWDRQNCLYTINESEAKTVRLIYSLCLENNLGIQAINRELRRLGLKGRCGRFLHPKTIYNILKKRMYCGQYEQFRQVTRKTGQKSREVRENQEEKKIVIVIPAIVLPETYEKVQEQLRRNKILAQRNVRHEYLLRGLLYCPECGRRLAGTHLTGCRKRKPEKIYHYYLCGSRLSPGNKADHRCQALRIPASELDTAVWDVLRDIACGSDALAMAIRRQSTQDDLALSATMAQQIAELEKKRNIIVGWFKDNILGENDAKKELKNISREIESLRTACFGLEFAEQGLPSAGRTVGQLLGTAPFAERRAVVAGLGLKVSAARNNEGVVEFWFES